jgi:hypothetical protein
MQRRLSKRSARSHLRSPLIAGAPVNLEILVGAPQSLSIANDFAGKRPPRQRAGLIGLMYSEDERVALMAADKVLDRAWGRPKEADQPTSHEQRFAAMSPDERAADAIELVARIRARLAACRAIEHEPEE